jgi:nucleotide-binding universal stress UspA family protein
VTLVEGAVVHERIVVGWDASAGARDALALARALRGRSGAVVAASVHAQSAPRSSEEAPPEVATALRAAEAACSEPWLQTRAVTGSSVAHGLHRVAEEGADLVVIGSSTGGESGHVWTGTTGGRLLTGSPCPVAVAPEGYRDREARGLSVLGVPFDGGPEADTALFHAAALASGADAAIRVITVVPPLEVWAGESRFAAFEADEEFEAARLAEYERIAGGAKDKIGGQAPVEPSVRAGDPVDEIVAAAREGIDLIVMGSRNYGPLRSVMAGSTAIELLHRAPCPVIVLPRTGS